LMAFAVKSRFPRPTLEQSAEMLFQGWQNPHISYFVSCIAHKKCINFVQIAQTLLLPRVAQLLSRWAKRLLVSRSYGVNLHDASCHEVTSGRRPLVGRLGPGGS